MPTVPFQSLTGRGIKPRSRVLLVENASQEDSASIGFARSMQNFAVGEFSEPQDRHPRVNGDAQLSQNFARSGFLAPHFEQRIAPLSPEPCRLHGCYIIASLCKGDRYFASVSSNWVETGTSGKLQHPTFGIGSRFCSGSSVL